VSTDSVYRLCLQISLQSVTTTA